MTPEAFATTLASVRQGDARALDVLCRAYYPTVERIAHNALRRELGARANELVSLFSTGDVVQDVFRKVVSNIGDVAGNTEGEFIGYLVSAVRTRLLDLVRFHHAIRRDRRRTTGSDLLEHQSQSVQPVSQLSATEQVRVYFSVLDGLEPRERTLLVRRLDGGAAFETIAIELQFPTADAARKAFHRAQARLLLRLRQLGVTGSQGDTR